MITVKELKPLQTFEIIAFIQENLAAMNSIEAFVAL